MLRPKTDHRTHEINKNSMMLQHLATTKLPTRYGLFDLMAFEQGGIDHLALLPQGVQPREGALVRIHSECLTGDALGSQRCDCGQQLHAAMKKIAASDNAMLLYLRGQEGRGIGLGNKIRAYALQDQGVDTVTANHQLGFGSDQRDYAAAANILHHFGLHAIHLLTNNPAKVEALETLGVQVLSHQPLVIKPSALNKAYLSSKRDQMGHWLPQNRLPPRKTSVNPNPPKLK
jgi:3,4-dihydroxy 2-butanone 4-phosphate synthase/GTP cyclohydrolase II